MRVYNVGNIFAGIICAQYFDLDIENLSIFLIFLLTVMYSIILVCYLRNIREYEKIELLNDV